VTEILEIRSFWPSCLTAINIAIWKVVLVVEGKEIDYLSDAFNVLASHAKLWLTTSPFFGSLAKEQPVFDLTLLFVTGCHGDLFIPLTT